MKIMKQVKQVAKKVAAKTVAVGKIKIPAAKRSKTIIEAKIDVGFGNNLFVRGHGAGLSWNRGTPLICVEPGTWRWTAPTNEKLTFKLLLNDSIWAQGGDIVAMPGKQVKVSPSF
jgi:hypothetical protein